MNPNRKITLILNFNQDKENEETKIYNEKHVKSNPRQHTCKRSVLCCGGIRPLAVAAAAPGDTLVAFT
jgi:hypothetical protein